MEALEQKDKHLDKISWVLLEQKIGDPWNALAKRVTEALCASQPSILSSSSYLRDCETSPRRLNVCITQSDLERR